METKTKVFDAVAESRKWKEATSQKLNAMSQEERLNYLNEVRTRYATDYAARKHRSDLKTPSSCP
jgi:F0F1-type ATP synthase delta subunit